MPDTRILTLPAQEGEFNVDASILRLNTLLEQVEKWAELANHGNVNFEREGIFILTENYDGSSLSLLDQFTNAIESCYEYLDNHTKWRISRALSIINEKAQDINKVAVQKVVHSGAILSQLITLGAKLEIPSPFVREFTSFAQKYPSLVEDPSEVYKLSKTDLYQFASDFIQVLRNALNPEDTEYVVEQLGDALMLKLYDLRSMIRLFLNKLKTYESSEQSDFDMIATLLSSMEEKMVLIESANPYIEKPIRTPVEDGDPFVEA